MFRRKYDITHPYTHDSPRPGYIVCSACHRENKQGNVCFCTSGIPAAKTVLVMIGIIGITALLVVVYFYV